MNNMNNLDYVKKCHRQAIFYRPKKKNLWDNDEYAPNPPGDCQRQEKTEG